MSMSTPTHRRDWPARVLLIAVSVLCSLVLLEIATREVRGGPPALIHWPNLAWDLMRESDDSSCSYVHDDMLGWASPANCVSADYNVDAQGFRRKPGIVSPAGQPVLATGSSFAMGIEVADAETWPAYLEQDLGRPVLNAGVSGYSLDQSVLETERLAQRFKPAVIIMSFTPGDVWRNELSMAYSRHKPYFVPTAGGGLELRGVPIAKPPHAPPLPVLARWLGWSMLAAEVVERLGIRDGWYYSEARALPLGDGDTVACRLMPRLAKLGIPVVVLAQYGLGYWGGDADYRAASDRAVANVMRCAGEAGLVALDLAQPLKAALDARGRAALYRSEHHSAEGNRWVAERLARELAQRHLLPAVSE
jgi:hypothetical protein